MELPKIMLELSTIDYVFPSVRVLSIVETRGRLCQRLCTLVFLRLDLDSYIDAIHYVKQSRKTNFKQHGFASNKMSKQHKIIIQMSKHRTSNTKIKNPEVCRTSAFPQKVRLTDLCPEEKAKVGELMLLMEKEKNENYELKQKILGLEQQNQSLQSTIQTLDKKIEDMNEDIKEMEHKLQAALTANKKKQGQVQQLMRIYEKFVNRKMTVGSTQTDEQAQCSFGIQVETQVKERKKKKKCRNVKVQTQTVEIVKRHSKSFEKIMRSNGELMKDRANLRIGKSQAKSGKSIGQSAHSRSHHSSNQVNTHSDSQQSAQMLAKAWQELKKHKLSQNPPQIPQQNSRLRKQSELQYSQESSQKVVQQYLKLKRNHDQKHYTFNDQQLNKHLKSKQFQARKLLESIKKSDRSQQSDGRLDFYQTNLLDIVNSINK